MRRRHPFRFKRPKRKQGRVYVVVYDHDPSRPVSSGVYVHARDTEKGGPGYDEAVAWAYANIDDHLKPTQTLREGTKDLFTESCLMRRRQEAKGRSYSSQYWSQHRSRLEHYIWPRWGSYVPDRILPAAIDDWLITLDNRTTGLPASPGQCDKILQTFRKALDELEYRRVITQGQNPARLVSYFTDDEQKRLPITMEEFHVLFPEDIDELLRIWLSLPWATYFYIMGTCGLRPGETAGIDLEHWVHGVGIPIAQAIDPDTREIKKIKTAKKGVVVKPAYFNHRAESLLTMMIYQGAPTTGLLFTVNDRAIIPDVSNKHLKGACKRAGVNLAGRSQYSLRHFFATEIARELDEKEAAEYLGQRVFRGEYDHRRVIDRLKSNDRLREVSNRIF